MNMYSHVIWDRRILYWSILILSRPKFNMFISRCYLCDLGLNMDLMQQLVDRDDLHMAQDSMLVDIEDLTG